MTARRPSLGGDYFEALYQGDADPWRFATSPYEKEKYAETLRALGKERAASALEVGCSIGVLTLQLSALCDQLLATDVSETALAEASRRCARASNVAFRRVASAAGSFEGSFDLIVLSEVLYYWDEADLAEVARRAGAALRPDGRILMVHWLGETNYPMTADDAVSAFGAGLQAPFAVERSDRTQDYRLDLWRWRPALSSDGRAAAPARSPKGETPE